MDSADAAEVGAPRRGARGRFDASLRVLGSSLADRQIRWVLIAFTCFGVAEWVRWIGLLVYGFDEGGAAGAGLISMIQLVPAALVIPFASSLSDRFERSRVLIVSYVVAGLGTAGAGFAIVLDAPFLVVAVLAAIGLGGMTMIRPTVAALLPQLVGTPEALTAANVTSELILERVAARRPRDRLARPRGLGRDCGGGRRRGDAARRRRLHASRAPVGVAERTRLARPHARGLPRTRA